jgi:type IV secretory pathway VirB6-like protein
MSRTGSNQRRNTPGIRDKIADFLIKQFEAAMRKNDIEYGAALLYIGSTVSSFLFGIVEREISLILTISAVVILLYILGMRRRITDEYYKKLRAWLENGVYI